MQIQVNPLTAHISDPWRVRINGEDYVGATAEEAMRAAAYWLPQRGYALPTIFKAERLRDHRMECEWASIIRTGDDRHGR